MGWPSRRAAPSTSILGLKVASLSEPRLAQSFSQSSNADSGSSSSPPVVLGDQPNARVSHQQQSRGDKTHKPPWFIAHCVAVDGGKKEENQLQIELSLFEPGQLKKEGRSDRNHIWQRHNNLQWPVRGADKPSQKAGGSMLTIHFWNYLHIDPGTSAREARLQWP